MKILRILLKQNKIINIFIIAVSIAFFAVLSVLIININQNKIDINSSRSFEKMKVYQISDSLTGEKEASFFSNSDWYKTLMNFTEEIKSSQDITEYVAKWQPIYIADFKGDKSFDPNYEFGQSTPPVEKFDKTYQSVLSIHVNDSVLKLNKLSLESGRLFEKDDYTFLLNTKTIPVVLGNDYSNLYNLNDTIDIFLYGEKLKGKVIGFLSETQKIMTPNQPELIVDKYAILPSFSFDNSFVNLANDSKNNLIVRASMLNKVNSLILTEKDVLEVSSIMEVISKKTGFYEYELISGVGINMHLLINMTKTNIAYINIAIIIVFILTMITFTYTLLMKIKGNSSVYNVLLISGANMNTIRNGIRNEFVIIISICSLIPVLPSLIMTNWSLILFLIYLISCSIFIITIYLIISLYLKKYFQSSQIVEQLKR